MEISWTSPPAPADPLKNTTQDGVLMDSECLQGKRLHHLSRQPVPGPSHPHRSSPHVQVECSVGISCPLPLILLLSFPRRLRLHPPALPPMQPDLLPTSQPTPTCSSSRMMSSSKGHSGIMGDLRRSCCGRWEHPGAAEPGLWNVV